MHKTLKYIAIGIAALLALLLAAAAILAATFDPNDYKPLIIRLVQEKKQRTLSIPGDIKLSFFPKLGAELGKVSISEPKSNAEFASVDSARVSLALIPLLAKQLVVDQVHITGLRAHIRRAKDGTTNVDDLLSNEEPGGQPIRFDIDGVHLSDAHIMVDDRQAGRKLELSGLDLETGKIADRVPSRMQFKARIRSSQPDADARLALKTGFTLDLERKHYVLKGLDAAMEGQLAGFNALDLKLTGDADLKPATRRFALDGIKLRAMGKRAGDAIEAAFDIPQIVVADDRVSGGKARGEAKLVSGARTVTANVSLPAFEGSPQAFRLPALALDAVVREGALDVKAQLSGALSGNIDKLLFSSPQLTVKLTGRQGETAIDGSMVTPLSVDLKTQVVELPRLAADLSLPNPGGGMLKLKAGGHASANLDRQSAAAVLKGSLDQSAFDAKLGLSDFSPLAYTFDIGIDRIDLDRYQRKTNAPAKPTDKSGAEQPIDLAALQKLHAAGSMRVGALKAAGIKASNVRMDLRASGGKLDIQPLAANLYGGSATGALSITATNPARFALRQTLTGIDAGPLLKDAIDKDTLEGKGNVQVDVTSAGATFSQIKKGLNGSARLELRDGAIRGVNIAQMLREAKARLGQLRGTEAPQTGTGSTAEKTDFSELSGSFRIVNGIARNDDLTIKSPLLRVAGSGDINLPEDRLDYLVRATVVSTLQGQGGPELQALKGLTIPVRLSGPFAAIGWRVDVAGMASELAKQKLDERKDEVREKAQKSLDEQKEKIRGQLKEQLKGLLGK